MASLRKQVTVIGSIAATTRSTPQNGKIWISEETLELFQLQAFQIVQLEFNGVYAVVRVELLHKHSACFRFHQSLFEEAKNSSSPAAIVDEDLFHQFEHVQPAGLVGSVLDLFLAQDPIALEKVQFAVDVSNGISLLSMLSTENPAPDSTVALLLKDCLIRDNSWFSVDSASVWVESTSFPDDTMQPLSDEANASHEPLLLGQILPTTEISVRAVQADPRKQAAHCNRLGDPTEWKRMIVEDLGSPISKPAHVLVDWAIRSVSSSKSSRGILVTGPPGCGKTSLVKSWAKLGGLELLPVEMKKVYQATVGDGEEYLLQTITKTAVGLQPCVVFLDDIDGLFPHSSSSAASRTISENRLVPVFLSAMDSLMDSPARNQIFVVACSSRVEDVASSLLAPSYLGNFIQVPDLSEGDKVFLLQRSLDDLDVTCSSEVVGEVAKRCKGLVVAELSKVVRDAVLKANRAGEEISRTHFLDALDCVKPSSLHNGSMLTVAKANQMSAGVSEVAGRTSQQQELNASVLLPLKKPEVLKSLGVTSPRGVLLYGPSGNGKSLLGKWLEDSVVRNGLANFVNVTCTDLISKVVGDSEKAISSLFARARKASPCVLFMDHIEAIAPKRGFDHSSEQTFDRILSCLLVELDGMLSKEASSTVVLVAATEDREKLDPAVLRPGRFDKHVHVGLPSANERREILLHTVQQSPVESAGQLVNQLVDATDGWSGASLVGVCREAAMGCLRNDLNAMTIDHRYYLDAVKKYS